MNARTSLLGLALACAGFSACAQQGVSPMGEADYARMRAPGQKAAVMLSACGGNVPLQALEALSRANAKATVFVSSEAILGGTALSKFLLARPDLFEVGNLGSACLSKRSILESARDAARTRRPEMDKEIQAVREMASGMLAGSAAIEKVFGHKPKFYAFGSDFGNSAADPFEQGRLIEGVSAYLSHPSAKARYDALASSKAGFDAWVVMAKLDRGPKSPVSGQGSMSEQSIESALAKVKAAKITRKATEAWLPSKRAALGSELAPGR